MTREDKIALLKDTFDKLGIKYTSGNELVGYIEIPTDLPYEEVNFDFRPSGKAYVWVDRDSDLHQQTGPGGSGPSCS